MSDEATKELQSLVNKRAERDYKDLVDVLIKEESIMSIIQTAYKIACWNETRYVLTNRADSLDEDVLFAISICPVNVINLITDYYINNFEADDIPFFGGSDILFVIERALKSLSPDRGS